jgi:hypothetical protein
LRVKLDSTAKKAELRAAEKARKLEVAHTERLTLMDDLANFGEAVGFDVRRSSNHLVFLMSDLQIEFDASNEDGTVDLVEAIERTERYGLLYEHRLSKWVLTIDREKGHDEQLVLFDAGLEYLAYKVFGLEAADDTELLESEQEQADTAPGAPKRSL